MIDVSHKSIYSIEINGKDQRRVTNRLGSEDILPLTGPDGKALEARQSGERSLKKSLKNSIKSLKYQICNCKVVVRNTWFVRKLMRCFISDTNVRRRPTGPVGVCSEESKFSSDLRASRHRDLKVTREIKCVHA